MNIGLSPIEWSKFAALGGWSAGWPDLTAVVHSRCFRFGLAGLAVVLVALFGIGLGSWKGSFGDAAENQPAQLMAAATPEYAPPADNVAQAQSSGLAPTVQASVDGLKIVSQRWRRAGLGSKALFTFSLRNSNDYPIKDIVISCAFSRGDGTHLTDRSRVIHEMVKTRGRKTFTGVHVGFVNLNAERAKCAPIAASRI